MPSALAQNLVNVRSLQAPSSTIQPNPADAVCCITHLWVLIFRLTRLVLVFKNLRRKKHWNYILSLWERNVCYPTELLFSPKVHDSSPSPVAGCLFPSALTCTLQEKERVLEEVKVGAYHQTQFLWMTQVKNLCTRMKSTECFSYYKKNVLIDINLLKGFQKYDLGKVTINKTFEKIVGNKSFNHHHILLPTLQWWKAHFLINLSQYFCTNSRKNKRQNCK